MSVFVRQLIKNLQVSAPDCRAEDMARIEKALSGIDPYFDEDKAQCDIVAGYVAGAIPTLDGLTKKLEYDVGHLIRALAPPVEWNEVDRRLLDVITYEGWWFYQDAEGKDGGRYWELYSWLRSRIQEEGDFDAYGVVTAALTGRGIEKTQILKHTLRRIPGALVVDGRITSAGRAIQGRLDDLDALLGLVPKQHAVASLADLLLEVDPQRFDEVKPAFVAAAGQPEAVCLAEVVLDRNPEKYRDLATELLLAAEPGWDTFRAAQALLRHAPDQRDEAKSMAERTLADYVKARKSPSIMREGTLREGLHLIVDWLLESFGVESKTSAKAALLSIENDYHRIDLAKVIKRRLGQASTDLVVATVLYDFDESSKYGDMDYEKYVERSLPLLAGLDFSADADRIWALAEHKSKKVRDAAAKSLPAIGGDVEARATALLAAKKADARLTGARILAAISAHAPLAAALAKEKSAKVREVIEASLPADRRADPAPPAKAKGKAEPKKKGEPKPTGGSASGAWLEKAMKATASQKKPVRPWLEESKLPRLFWSDGAAVELPVVRYLLYRQSKAKGADLDADVRTIVEEVDRDRSGEFGLGMFNLFVAQKENNKDKFVLSLAAALGDDSVTVLLKRKILDWPENRRGKLSEFALNALAASGTPTALFTVDAAARRLRTQRRIQAHAAREIVLEAAKARGVERERMIDDVIPRHGFTGRERVVGEEKKRFTVGIGTDLKMKYTNDKGKAVKSLSKTIPAAEREQLAELSKNLRDLVKSHSVRLIDCMISQYAWPAERWRALFLTHPILFAFAARCVWGCYDGDALVTTFRALEDGTLTDVADDEVTATGTVKLLHPAVVNAEICRAWSTHLADYEIEQPFAQLDRPTTMVPAEEAELRIGRQLEGRPWDQFERARFARRSGWKHLMIYEEKYTACFKTFSGGETDLDAVLFVDQVENVVAGHYFASYRLDTIESGGFHVPTDDTDARLLPLGSVPRPIYAEAIAELTQLVT